MLSYAFLHPQVNVMSEYTACCSINLLWKNICTGDGWLLYCEWPRKDCSNAGFTTQELCKFSFTCFDLEMIKLKRSIF